MSRRTGLLQRGVQHRDADDSLTDCASVQHALRGALGEYQKHTTPAACLLPDALHAALLRARTLDPDSADWPDRPATGVYRLLETLRPATG